LTQSGVFSPTGTKARTVVIHAKPQFIFENLEGNRNSARSAIGKGVLDRIGDKLVDD